MEEKKAEHSPSEALRRLSVEGEVFFPIEKEGSAKTTASRLKRNGLGVYKTRTTDNGIYVKRLQ